MSDGDGTQNDDLIWKTEALGFWLRLLRTERGLSQRELQALSGVNDAEIHRVETGQQECRIESLLRLCGPLGVTAGWVLDHVASSDVDIFHKRILEESSFEVLADKLDVRGDASRRAISRNLASAAVLAAILVRCSRPASRLATISFPSDDLGARFVAFAEHLEGLAEGTERAVVLSGLKSSPVRELWTRGLIDEKMLRAHADYLKQPKTKRGPSPFGWYPRVYDVRRKAREMKMIPVKCPACGEGMDAEADMEGESINCPKCKKDFVAVRQKFSDAAIILLIIGIAGMGGGLLYNYLPGVIAAGFLAVVGAVLFLKK